MTDPKIEPALTAEGWKELREDHDDLPLTSDASGHYDHVGSNADGCAEIIAINNFLLPDSDPRKITREKIGWMRVAASGEPVWREGGWLRAFADALESYLPPEKPAT